MTSLLITAASLAESTSESGDPRAFGLLLLLLGPLVYTLIYLRYRNPGARHHYERETEAWIDGLKTGDTYLESRRRTRDEKIPGANSTELKGAGGAGKIAAKTT